MVDHEHGEGVVPRASGGYVRDEDVGEADSCLGVPETGKPSYK